MFNQITIIDDCGLTNSILEKISKLSRNPIAKFNDFPKTDEEILDRISNSDCILVSWQTRLNANVLRKSSSLKYIGMCCSLYDENSANVDISTARSLDIDVRGVKDYGDEGTVEFIFAQLIYLFKGLGQHKWRSEATELQNKSIGIVGMGTLGQMVAKTAIHFDMKVFYFSRTRKPEVEEKGIRYLPLTELLGACDVITTHLPKNTILLSEEEFKIKKKNSVLINTSLGPTFEIDAFENWLSRDKSSFGIFDADGAGNLSQELQKNDNVIISEQFAGFTVEAKQRLSEKVLANLENHLARE